jgi:two-component system phosphate regulon sensor histidine kinase PhoR
MFHTFRQRIAIPYILLILIVMLGTGLFLSSYLSQTYEQKQGNELESQARLISRSLSAILPVNSDPAYLDQLARQWAGDSGLRVTIISPDGTVIGESHEDRAQMENHLDRPEVVSAFQSGFGSSTRFSRTTGANFLYVAVPVVVDGTTAAVARVAVPVDQTQEEIAQLQRILLGSTFFTAVVGALIAWVIAGAATRPIRQLTKAATKMSQGEGGSRLAPTSEDEVGRLTQAINLLAVNLQSQIVGLKNERSKMSTILKEISDGVVLIEPDGRIGLVNSAAETMFSVTQDSVQGKTLAEGFRHHQLVELWQRSRERGESESAILEMASNRLYFHVLATPLIESMPGSTLLLFQNLTRQRYLETVRRDFISNISHELRTPLASLKALTETLREGALEDPPAAQRFLERMESEVDALTQMVSELVELSRIESGRVPLELLEEHPVEVLSAAVERLQLQADRAGIKINIDAPDGLPAILADSRRLEQVLVNLLHNAIKFSSPGGEIIISARTAELAPILQRINQTTLTEDKLVMLFSVKDSGIGIASEDLPRIFERFYKADRARSSGGTGLGLAIARHTIEAHGGLIWAESIEGKGSTFYFFIPLAMSSGIS